MTRAASPSRPRAREFVEDRGIEVADRVTGAGKHAGQRQRPATQRLRLEHGPVEGVRNRDRVRQVRRRPPSAAAGNVKKPHRHAGIDRADDVGGRRAPQFLGRHDLGQPQAPAAEQIRQQCW